MIRGAASGRRAAHIPAGAPGALRAAAVLLLCGAILLTPLPAPGAEGERLVLDEARVWDFAEQLFRQGEYYRAISEYRRLLHFFPKGRRRAAAQLRIGQALLWGDEVMQAIRHLDALAEDASFSAHRDDVLYFRALARLQSEQGRPYPLREESIAAGLADLRKISPVWPEREKVDGFVKAMDEPPELPEKSPGFAGTLSAIIPGTGSFYVGRYGEGALTFFVTALLIVGAVDAFEDDKDGLGVVLGSLGIAFYGGGILAAANGAHKFNDGHKARYLAEQRQRFGIVIDRGGIAGAFQKSF